MSDQHLEAAARELQNQDGSTINWEDADQEPYVLAADAVIEAWVGDRELYEYRPMSRPSEGNSENVKAALQATHDWFDALVEADLLVRVSVEGNQHEM